MPWLAVPGLAIIVGAFTVSGLLVNGLDRLQSGKVNLLL